MTRNDGEYNTKDKLVDNWTWCPSTVPGEAMGGEPGGNKCTGRINLGRPQAISVPRGLFWTTTLVVLTYHDPLVNIFLQKVSPLSLSSLGQSLLAVFFVPFWDERGTIFWGGARQGCSAYNILCCFLWVITVPVSYCKRSGFPPPPKSGIAWVCAHAAVTASPVRGNICLAFPDLVGERGGGVYIYHRIFVTFLLVSHPLGNSNW